MVAISVPCTVSET